MLSRVMDLIEKPIKNGTIIKSSLKITQYIGRGSYGMVYLAKDLNNDENVIIKQLRKRKRHEKVAYLEKEAQILKELKHPAIPKFIDLIYNGKDSFLVMEYKSGKNVEEIIFHDNRTFSEVDSLKILLKVLHIVKFIHESNIIHRDLRIPNIILSGSNVFIIDFGLAAFTNDKEDPYINLMSIEKRLFRQLSFCSDFYALGHFLLFLLYSGFNIPTKNDESWEEELLINIETKRIIRKLLKLDSCYEKVEDIILEVKRVIDTSIFGGSL